MDIKTFGILEKYCEKEGLKMAVPIQTNEEWFDTLSTEEKAKALYTMVFLMDWQRDVLNDAIMNNIDTEKAIEKWLKEKHHAE